jgi:hypothetical protein
MSDNVGKKYVWKLKPVIAIDINSAVEDVWHTLCELKGGVKVLIVSFVGDSAGTGIRLEWDITIDGYAIDPRHWGDYEAFMTNSVSIDLRLPQPCIWAINNIDALDPFFSEPLHEVLIKVRKVAGGGTTTDFSASVLYQKLEAV